MWFIKSWFASEPLQKPYFCCLEKVVTEHSMGSTVTWGVTHGYPHTHTFTQSPCSQHVPGTHEANAHVAVKLPGLLQNFGGMNIDLVLMWKYCTSNGWVFFLLIYSTKKQNITGTSIYIYVCVYICIYIPVIIFIYNWIIYNSILAKGNNATSCVAHPPPPQKTFCNSDLEVLHLLKSFLPFTEKLMMVWLENPSVQTPSAVDVQRRGTLNH